MCDFPPISWLCDDGTNKEVTTVPGQEGIKLQSLMSAIALQIPALFAFLLLTEIEQTKKSILHHIISKDAMSSRI